MMDQALGVAGVAAAAALYQPSWIGAIGAITATAAEGFRLTTHPLWDENWVNVAVSRGVMGSLAPTAS